MSNYCKPHGVFVGDPYGPDYMCGLCESGLTKEVTREQATLWFRYTDEHLEDDTGVPWTKVSQWTTDNAPSFDDIRLSSRSLSSWWELFNDTEADVLALVQHKVTINPFTDWVDPYDPSNGGHAYNGVPE